VENAWDWWSGRIAIVGGIDMDFLARKTPEEIYERALRLLEKTSGTGGFALGSGNSIPDYVPFENHLAMIRAAVDFRV
jgi:uroporphyrinogen decarboxylase